MVNHSMKGLCVTRLTHLQILGVQCRIAGTKRVKDTTNLTTLLRCTGIVQGFCDVRRLCSLASSALSEDTFLGSCCTIIYAQLDSYDSKASQYSVARRVSARPSRLHFALLIHSIPGRCVVSRSCNCCKLIFWMSPASLAFLRFVWCTTVHAKFGCSHMYLMGSIQWRPCHQFTGKSSCRSIPTIYLNLLYSMTDTCLG